MVDAPLVNCCQVSKSAFEPQNFCDERHWKSIEKQIALSRSSINVELLKLRLIACLSNSNTSWMLSSSVVFWWFNIYLHVFCFAVTLFNELFFSSIAHSTNGARTRTTHFTRSLSPQCLAVWYGCENAIRGGKGVSNEANCLPFFTYVM